MLNSRSGVATVDLNIKYKKPIRVDLFYVFEGNVIKRDGRKIWVKGQIK
jgi:acyl-coenzyme A thioesterase PaaI-like protein